MDISSEYPFRIFISSTEYNLVDLRAELAHYLDDLGYRPILSSFEGFPDSFPNLEPWESCLPVLESCFVVILVIDGRYGTSLDWVHFKDLLNGRKVAPTHAEYLLAHKLRKRMLVFIRRDVLTYYESYKTAMKNTGNDVDKAKELLNQTLPPRIDFETLQFISEVKTTQPIPWIKTFDDVNTVKQEIQKKMMNELAEVFLLKEKHLEVVKKAFSGAMEGLTPEKRRELLLSVGFTKELIDEAEALKEKLGKVEKELHDAKTDAKKVKQLQSEKTELEKDLADLREKIKKTENPFLAGTILSNDTVNAEYIKNHVGWISPTAFQVSSPNRLGGYLDSIYGGFTDKIYFNNRIADYTSPVFIEKCDQCGRKNDLGSIRVLKNVLNVDGNYAHFVGP